MTDEIINQAISEATVQTETVAETPVETREATAEVPNQESNEPEEVIFPKKAINALSRRDKQIGKLQAERAALQAELQRYRQTETQKVKEAPKEDAFDNYGEYLEAKIKHGLQEEQTNSTKNKEAEAEVAQLEAWTTERSQYAISKSQEAINSIPEYKQLFMDNAEVLQNLPPHVERAFLEADEPALAFYALAKEGNLDLLFDMSPSKAAIAIGRAEVRGAALSKAKQQTKAPAPIDSLRGTGQSNKTISAKTDWQDLQKWLNS